MILSWKFNDKKKEAMFEIKVKDIEWLLGKFKRGEFMRPVDVSWKNKTIHTEKRNELFIGRNDYFRLYRWVSFEFMSSRAKMMAMNRKMFVEPFINMALEDITYSTFGRYHINADMVVSYMATESLDNDELHKIKEYLK